MVKIIGRIVFLYIMMVSIAVHAIEMRLTTAQGMRVKSVRAQERYNLEFLIDSSVQLTSDPQIDHDENVVLGFPQHIQQHAVVNGIQTANERKIVYSCEFIKEGTAHIGPVMLATQQGPLQAEGFTLPVAAAPKNSKKRSELGTSAELYIAPKKYFIGEVVPFTLRLISPEHSLSVRGMSSLDIEGCQLIRIGQGELRTEERGDETMYIVEWQGNFVPEKKGRCSIQPVTFEYTHDGLRQQNNGFFNAFALFGFGPTVERCQTKATSVYLDELPVIDKQCCGVGVINSVSITTDSLTFPQGDAATLKLVIAGAGALETFITPSLKLPSSCKLYPSTASVAGRYPQQKKEYEYIVQCNEVGQLQIPEQELIFFNPQKQQYEKYITNELSLQITANKQLQDASEIVATNVPADAHLAQQVVASANKQFFVYSQSPIIIPFWLFILLLLVPMLWVMSRGQREALIVQVNWHCKKRHLLFELRKAAAAHDATFFIKTFEQLVMVIINRHEMLLAGPGMHEYFALHGFDDASWNNWKTFVQKLQASAFASQTLDFDKALNESTLWINKFLAARR